MIENYNINKYKGKQADHLIHWSLSMYDGLHYQNIATGIFNE